MKKLSQCQSCKKDFQARLKKAYRLGMQDQQLKLQITINNLTNTHAELWNELARLDRVAPLPDADETIRLPLKTVQHLIKIIGKHKMGSTVRYLRKLIDNQLGSLPNLLDKTKESRID